MPKIAPTVTAPAGTIKTLTGTQFARSPILIGGIAVIDPDSPTVTVYIQTSQGLAAGGNRPTVNFDPAAISGIGTIVLPPAGLGLDPNTRVWMLSGCFKERSPTPVFRPIHATSRPHFGGSRPPDSECTQQAPISPYASTPAYPAVIDRATASATRIPSTPAERMPPA